MFGKCRARCHLALHTRSSVNKQNEICNNLSEDDSFPEFVYIRDVLDLHGFFPEQIPEILRDFIANAKELNLHELRLIHGKGKSRIKHVCYSELRKNPYVERFYDAPPERGGWGATIIELKPDV